jgi:hypothetical protein
VSAQGATRRAELREIPLHEAVRIVPGAILVTMAEGQWDTFHAVAYEEGATLLELDAAERPIHAYRIAKLAPETAQRLARQAAEDGLTGEVPS